MQRSRSGSSAAAPGHRAGREDGTAVLDATRPKEFGDLSELLHPCGEEVFFGAYDPATQPHGLGERLIRAMPAMKGALPAGDFRDWEAIDAWAHEIAAILTRDSPGNGLPNEPNRTPTKGAKQ